MSCRALLWILACLLVSTVHGDEKPRVPGPTPDGFLLPNGWMLTPVGEQITLPDLPLNIIPLADGKRVLTATSGYNKHELSIIDVPNKEILATETVRESWFGLTTTPAQDRVWWAGGGSAILHRYDLKDGKLARIGSEEKEATRVTKDFSNPKNAFRSGIHLDAEKQILYSLDMNAGTLTAIDLPTNKPRKVGTLGGRPYDIVRKGPQLFVSDWAGRMVLAVEPTELRVLARIPVGEHPNQLAAHPADDRLFVACASSNSVAVIDTKRGYVTETIFTSLFPRSPEGSTPDALAIAPDGKALYVANADNNCVAVIDISVPNESVVKGFIPTGWYPTAVAVSPDSKTIYVGVGKGNQTKPNPLPPGVAPKADGPRRYPYIGTTLSGALSIIPVPEEKKLREYTARVYRNCPYSDKIITTVPYARKTAIPTKVGDPSPITHVLYIIKENRTYDQVFGAMERGNGDPSLVMFGEEVTPNHHKLAREFVLLDNLYCNGQVSRDGHPWSTMAYNTDYISRDWHLTYSRRVGVADDEQGNLSRGPSGYLWDACARHGISYRSYGEYGGRVSQPDGSVKMEARVPGLVGHMCPDYGIPKKGATRARDTDNVEVFLKEFRKYEENNNLPRFIIMSLGEDHTSGTTPGAFTPKACVASNDLALGRLVDAISRSRYWPKMAIFVIEDDAQNGPDHVDAHRTVGLVISPYVRRKHLDSTQYQTVSMIRTIELILGLPPLSQYDAAARPMFESFTDQADLTPYAHLPARINLNEVNKKTAYAADRSAKMDWSEYDRIDDFELNEILWRSIKGANAPLPPAVRRAIAYRPQSTEK